MNHTGSIISYENLRLSNESFEAAFKNKFDQFLQKGWYILGKEVESFEQDFAAYCDVPYCVGVANGLDALELGLKVFDFEPGSEIIVASNTYIATILAIINSGHFPVLVEPDIHTYNIDPTLIERSITPKTRAIMVVHLYGRLANMDAICDIAARHNLEIIEDCAQAHGAMHNGKMAGTFGKIGAYSFYPTKNLGALGDAGAMITSDAALYAKLKALRNYGSQQKYHNKYVGRNSRLDELQAAFLNVKLPFLDNITRHKQELAALYQAGLTDRVIKPAPYAGNEHVFHIYNIRTSERRQLQDYLLESGIHTDIHYPVSPNQQEGYRSYFSDISYPVSEEIHATTLSLPISYATTTDQVKEVINKINSFFQ